MSSQPKLDDLSRLRNFVLRKATGADCRLGEWPDHRVTKCSTATRLNAEMDELTMALNRRRDGPPWTDRRSPKTEATKMAGSVS
jgi:hypothetical protein